MIDASKLAEELHNEQEQTSLHENDSKILESKLRELQTNIEETENSTVRNGKKMVVKMEERIRELIVQIDDEGRRMADALKNYRKTERGVKEYIYRGNEDKKNSERIRELIAQIDDEGRRMADALKNYRKTERGVKEYIYRGNEDKKNSERIKDLIDKLQNQVRMFKKQLEEAEDIASNNL